MIRSFEALLRATTRRAGRRIASRLPESVVMSAADWIEAVAGSHVPMMARLARRAGRSAALLRASIADRYLSRVDALLRAGQFDEAVQVYRSLIALRPTLSVVYPIGLRHAKTGHFGDEFSRAAVRAITDPGLRRMSEFLLASPANYHPSRLWLYFLIYNAFQLELTGLSNFKRTLNHNYYNWTGDDNIRVQVASLLRALALTDAALATIAREVEAPPELRPAGFSQSKWTEYAVFLATLQVYASRSDRLGLLETCVEPSLGNPLYTLYRGQRVTQDLCNSVIELNTIFQAAPWLLRDEVRVAELGAGHGRIGSLLLQRVRAKLTIIDIPPALHVSQWYLTHQFPHLRAFEFRPFASFAEVEADFRAADIAFLSPAQVELLPPDLFDLFINICSLQEMTPPQIANWFSHIDRLCAGCFYMKQFLRSENNFDGVTIHRADYPVPAGWRPLFDREQPANGELFEAMYEVRPRA